MKTVEEREALKTTATTKKTNKDRKEQGETEAIVKGWKLNEFAVHLTCALNKPKFWWHSSCFWQWAIFIKFLKF